VFNAHIHLPPNFSAFETLEEALDQAAEELCAVLGASNYYDFSVYDDFTQGARERGIHPTCGIEILCRDEEAAEKSERYNDPANPGKIYLCGKSLTRWKEGTPRSREILSRIRRGDEARMAAMTQKLQEIFSRHGLEGPDAETIRANVAARHQVPVETVVLQERHVAQAYEAMLEGNDTVWQTVAGTAPGAKPDVRTHLLKAGKPAFVAEGYVTVDEGIELVHELGGIPSYPVLADGTNPICELERDLDGLIARLKRLGISAAEFIPNRNAPEVLTRYVAVLSDASFIVTCGTEHNTTERLPLLARCKDGSAIPEAVMDIFWSGTTKLMEHETHA
jgi:hypothetical protein